VAVAIALNAGPREFWFHFGEIEIGPAGARARVREIENLATGERRVIEWGGVRLRIEPSRDPAVAVPVLGLRSHGNERSRRH